MIKQLTYTVLLGLLICSCSRQKNLHNIVDARLDKALVSEHFKGNSTAAINYLLENFDEVIITEGEYRIDPKKIILPKKHVSIVGEGDVALKAFSRGTLFTMYQHDLRLENIHFKDVFTTVDVKLTRKANLIIENCKFDGGFRYVVYGSREYAIPLNLSFFDNNINGKSTAKITGSRGGIWLDCAYSKIEVEGNTFINIKSDRATRAIGLSSVFENKSTTIGVKNNIIENISGAQNIEVQAIMAFAQNTLIDSNYISNVTADQLPSDDCEGIYTKSLETTISNNTLINAGNSEGAIVVKGTTRRGKPRTQISNNTIEDNRPKNNNNQYSNGIVVRAPENTIVENNIIKGVFARGIEIEGSNIYLTKNVIIKNNLISEIGSDGIKLISNCSNCGNITITDNVFKSINVSKTKKSIYPIYIGTGLTEIGDLKHVKISNNQVDKTSTISNNVLVYRRSGSHNIDEVDILDNKFDNAKRVSILDNLKSKKKNLKLSKSKEGSRIRKIK